jgi:endonuclease YncB( thermonuclease family)
VASCVFRAASPVNLPSIEEMSRAEIETLDETTHSQVCAGVTTKYGRTLAKFTDSQDKTISKVFIDEGMAVEYEGQNRPKRRW